MQNFEKLSDVELIKLAKTDEYAVDEIFARYKPLVSKVARQFFLVGGDLDDLVQEGMIGLYKAIIGYEESKKASFKTFASLCILRNIQTAIKKANSHKNMYFLELYDMLYGVDVPTNKENPESNLIEKQNVEHLTKLIDKNLSSFEKQVLNLYINGQSYQQIAENLESNKKSVDNALNRIRTKLLHQLDDTAK